MEVIPELGIKAMVQQLNLGMAGGSNWTNAEISEDIRHEVFTETVRVKGC